MIANSQMLDQQSLNVKSLPPVKFVWLEITGQCNLACTHCYAESTPTGTHGSLTHTEWKDIITQAKSSGAEMVQFIGGEPTIHPHFSELVRFAASVALKIEVYTNLVKVPEWMWSLFEECNVSLATSFYSSQADVHDRVTTRAGSQRKTLSNIKIALTRSIPLRVGIIQVLSEQDVSQTEQMLRSLGVVNIHADIVRGVGRGVGHNSPERPVDALCGHCTSGKAMVDPNGWVYPCIFSRWLKIGNIRDESFSEIVDSETMRVVREDLDTEFSARRPGPRPPGPRPPGPRPPGPSCLPSCVPGVGCLPPARPPISPCPPTR